ncbi:MAG TPA: glycosyltransferase family 2 protein [Gemmatimonadaceae bacterium]|nr:glycosyltransferase family 2 protein [Gemmatimonadaceae bacterium]
MSERVACIIPAYCAAHTLSTVLQDCREALPGARIIVVDDGSPDPTATVARDLADWTIRLSDNRGKGAALRAGFAEALRGEDDVVVTIDADGQHDPVYAPSLLRALEGFDIVIGQRVRAGSSMPLRRRMTNAMASMAIARVGGVRLEDTQSGFRAIRRRVLERVRGRGDRYEFETDFLIRAMRAGFRVRNATIPTVYGSVSHFRGMRDSVRIVRTIWAHRRATVDAEMS